MAQRATTITARLGARAARGGSSGTRPSVPATPAGGRNEAAGVVVEPGERIDRQEAIRRRAYAIWEGEGRPEGKQVEHWLRAEQLIASERSD